MKRVAAVVWLAVMNTPLLATLYSTVEKKPEWLDWAKHGVDFINKCCFDTDGRMFFSVTREGKPLRMMHVAEILDGARLSP